MSNFKKSQINSIRVRNARENNLRNLSLDIPKNSYVLVTGRSGSGKSSLVHDVIGNEAQRRYLEQLNPKVRSLMSGVKRAKVEKIEGLSPVVSLDQQSFSFQQRSTVGTLSGIFDHFRLIFARYGSGMDHLDKKLTRSHFSFNQKEGQCPHCNGIGNEEFIDPEIFVIDPSKTIKNGALSLTTPTGYVIYSQVTLDVLEDVCKAEGFSLDIPWKNFTDEQRDILFYGSEAIKVPFGKHTLESRMKWTGITAKPREEGYFRGILTIMEEILKRDRNKNILKYTNSRVCRVCHGYRLNQLSLGITWQGLNIGEWAELCVSELSSKLQIIVRDKPLNNGELVICDALIKNLESLKKLGIEYLKLNREARSLSRGEAKRIRLSSLIRPEMAGLIYTLDEPTVGLHPSDHHNLLSLLKDIQHNGNTILCIDHKLFGFSKADYWIEIGPGAGKNGGDIIIDGWMDDVVKNSSLVKNSITWPYLNGTKKLIRRTQDLSRCKEIKIYGACKNNLKYINPIFYQGALNVICGVSGAGKSSLLNGVLKEVVTNSDGKGKYGRAEFSGSFKRVIQLNQDPIGRTPRSNPVTYIKVFDKIRDLFAGIPEAKEKSFTKSHFSFNVEGGRCPKCLGAGKIEIGLSYLGKIETDCDLCFGKRFNQDVLEIKYKGLTISDVLNLEVAQACEFFFDKSEIHYSLSILNDLGLGYLHLGQSSSTLSGGEAQRVKLVAELVKGKGKDNLYLLDEPTNGLHYDDIQILIDGFEKLVDKGNTIIIVEHDPYIIELSDWIVELGPFSGDRGGEIVFMGNSKELLSSNTLMSNEIHKSQHLQFNPFYPSQSSQKVFDIELNGINTHNLKNIDVRIPVNKVIGVTGVSGSGKTSLVFDSIFEQSKFLYSQVFSTYIRTLLGGNRPAFIDETRHLLPAIGISFRIGPGNSMSTVGTLLGIYPIIRLMFSRFSIDKEGNSCTLWAKHFSYMDSAGACPECDGNGFILSSDEKLIVNKADLSVQDGAMSSSRPSKFFSDPNGQYFAIFQSMCKSNNIEVDTAWKNFTESEKMLVLYGSGAQEYDVVWRFRRKGRAGEHRFKSVWKGFIPLINEDYYKKKGTSRTAGFSEIMMQKTCSHCKGKRLNVERQNYLLFEEDIAFWSSISIKELGEFLINIKRNSTIRYEPKVKILIDELIGHLIKIIARVNDLGLGYLSLIRRASELSSGEYQRVRLLGQLASGLSGIIYIIDEPGASLHPENLLAVANLFDDLRDEGNTVLFTDHKPELLSRSDYLIELGPGAGSNGGKILYQGEVNEQVKRSFEYNKISLKPNRSYDRSALITLENIKYRNLRIDKLTLNKGWTSISGVSGSGKSSLLNGVILNGLRGTLDKNRGQVNVLTGDYIIISPEETKRQWPWSKTPINVLGIDTLLYKEFAKLEASALHKVKSTDFKPGSKKFACQNCLSKGYVTESLDFLGDAISECPECGGTGYSHEIDRFLLNGNMIHDLMKVELNQIWDFLPESQNLAMLADIIKDLGLEYLQAGQHGNLLSEGEKQRLFLAKHLVMSGGPSQHIFLFDEPTRGLHANNIAGFVKILHALIADGHSLITIDHEEDLIRCADWNINLGPGAGDQGGALVYEGIPKHSD